MTVQRSENEQASREGADEHWTAIDSAGDMARCSLWWSQTPAMPGETAGLIGHYEAGSDEAAGALLERACAELRGRGCTTAIGPMDGNTWRRYRWVTEAGSEPPFLLEPANPASYPRQWEAAGFRPISGYSSAINDNLGRQDPRMAEVRRRVEADGIRIRPIDPSRFEEELGRVYEVSVVSFRNNFLYTPMSFAEFVGQYRKVERLIRPELVLIAEWEGRTVGFMFGLPDMMQAERGERVERILLKTVAVLPERRCAGLGGLLISLCEEAGRRLGFTRSIYALMHDSNASRSIASHHGARTIRRYALYGRGLR